MLTHPQFDPVALHLGPISLHWYGVTYFVAFVLFLALGSLRIRAGQATLTQKNLDDLMTYGILGVVLGGRFGYVFFYQFDAFLADPLYLFRIWEGGMSFHGGFLGVVLALMLFARKNDLNFLDIADFVAPLVPLGLASGRIGNFVGGELWGRVTSPEAPWAMLFPQARHQDVLQALTRDDWASWLDLYGGLPRHPSQLYQFALEGVLLFVILWLFTRQKRARGQAAALFLVGYGVLRFIAEFAREPDDFLGLLALNLSMGQWLSLPMVLLGVYLFGLSRSKVKV